MWDWLKKWGLWILLGLGALLAFVVRLFPTSRGKPEILQKAKDGVEAIKQSRADALKAHELKMEEKKDEIDSTEAIDDEEERLKRLADMANRSLKEK